VHALVDDVTDHVIKQDEIAIAVGAFERTDQNWSRGQTRTRDDTANRVLDLAHLVSELREVYTDEVAEQGEWLRHVPVTHVARALEGSTRMGRWGTRGGFPSCTSAGRRTQSSSRRTGTWSIRWRSTPMPTERRS
jgi:hypothetical protein